MSLDIETTGLNRNIHSIVEVGAVCTEVNGDKYADKTVHELRLLVMPIAPLVIDPFCAMLHTRLWDEMVKFEKAGVSPAVSRANVDGFVQFTGQCLECDIGLRLAEFVDACWPEQTSKRAKITVAGKNAASFDLPFLRHRAALDAHMEIRHRVLDVTSMYYQPGDEWLPDLNTCLARAGINKQTAHGALADAYLVVQLVTKAFENKFQ